jgi:hypothetical protein
VNKDKRTREERQELIRAETVEVMRAMDVMATPRNRQGCASVARRHWLHANATGQPTVACGASPVAR